MLVQFAGIGPIRSPMVTESILHASKTLVALQSEYGYCSLKGREFQLSLINVRTWEGVVGIEVEGRP